MSNVISKHVPCSQVSLAYLLVQRRMVWLYHSYWSTLTPLLRVLIYEESESVCSLWNPDPHRNQCHLWKQYGSWLNQFYVISLLSLTGFGYITFVYHDEATGLDLAWFSRLLVLQSCWLVINHMWLNCRHFGAMLLVTYQCVIVCHNMSLIILPFFVKLCQ